jgi:hypothetical protein
MSVSPMSQLAVRGRTLIARRAGVYHPMNGLLPFDQPPASIVCRISELILQRWEPPMLRTVA